MSTQVETTENGYVITNKAGWTAQEFGIIGFFIVAAVSTTYTALTLLNNIPLAVVCAVVLLGVGAWIAQTAASRKKRSTLHLKREGDVFEIWMTKPLEHKWGQRMDAGKNKFDLSTLSSAGFVDFQGDPVLKLGGGDRALFVPRRLAEVDEVRRAIRATAKEEGRKVEFGIPTHEEPFNHYLATGEIIWRQSDDNSEVSATASTTVGRESNASKKPRAPRAAAETAAPANVAPVITELPERPVRVLGYDEYQLRPVEDEVEIAVYNANLEQDRQEKESRRDAGNDDVSNILLPGSSKSITINL